MPSAHYRRRRIAQSKTVALYANKNIDAINIFNENNTAIINFQNNINEIVDIISTLDIDTVKNKINELLQAMNTKQELYGVFDLIENNLISIISNIANGVDINIVRNRVEYIKDLLS